MKVLNITGLISKRNDHFGISLLTKYVNWKIWTAQTNDQEH